MRTRRPGEHRHRARPWALALLPRSTAWLPTALHPSGGGLTSRQGQPPQELTHHLCPPTGLRCVVTTCHPCPEMGQALGDLSEVRPMASTVRWVPREQEGVDPTPGGGLHGAFPLRSFHLKYEQASLHAPHGLGSENLNSIPSCSRKAGNGSQVGG